MKKSILSLTLALTLPAFSQITADVAISEAGAPLGTITLELDHLNAPMASANFIGLVTGELPWIDSTTGVVRTNTPYYSGIKIHRTVKGFVSQFGSQRGDGSDGPGYTFPDQPDLASPLSHDGPYVLSMANSGPNSNGSQVFITAAARTDLDPRHVIFGKVALGPSRTLADYINCVPVVDADGADDMPGNSDDDNTPVTDLVITSATINMNGVSFDIHAQGLPQVYAPTVTTALGPQSTDIAFLQPSPSFTSLSISEDLLMWSPLATRYLDSTQPAIHSLTLFGQTLGQPRQFFAPSIVHYDASALFPASLTGRTLTTLTPLDSDDAIVFSFSGEGTGSGGTWIYRGFTGPINVDLFLADGYGCRLIITASGFSPSYFSFRRIGFDNFNENFLLGRTSGTVHQSSTSTEEPISLNGVFALSR